ncbi:hypothetical protein [Rubrivivax albus]|uniref:Uncharacterized protein n=1 Tax=Rubrivivax albus TaxID=2499835 RepID=A0A3S3S7K5_9BURK|nr:hypothetical protein [Rubrivivax albus]RVT47480.1 hypothetical protein ENE75_24045 [Rubrivivax albus]
MAPSSDRRFLKLKTEIAEAGAFGDGIDTSSYDLHAELGATDYSPEQRLEVWIALLCDLASEVDNSDWETVQKSKLARVARATLAASWVQEPLLIAAVRALDESEDGFFYVLSEVFALYVDGSGRAHAHGS